MFSITPDDVSEELEKYERTHLDRLSPAPLDVRSMLDAQSPYRVNALAKFWERDDDPMIDRRLKTLIVGSWSPTSRSTQLTWSLMGTAKNINVYVSLGHAQHTPAQLSGMFPNIEIAASPTAKLGTLYRDHFREMALIRGLPGKQTDESPRLDPLLRAMRGRNWGLVIQATPRLRDELYAERRALLDRMTYFASNSRRSVQETQQTSEKKTELKTSGTTTTLTGDFINWQIQHLVEILEYEHQRHEEALTTGAWWVTMAAGAETRADLERLTGLVTATFSGTSDTRSERLTSHLCMSAGESPDEFQTYMTSAELALLTQLPLEETPGFALRDYAAFDTEFTPPPATDSIALGAILQDGHETKHEFTIALNDLAKHGLIAGVTGSGKSTTLMTLLENVHRQGVPFCIIEPAKTEYRGWLETGSPIPGTQIYTLGNENVAPFRLNPFEFQTGDSPDSSSVLEHIDHLKAVFNAAFVLYAPMPYVLDMALHEIYGDLGWDLASGRNTRLPVAQWANRHLYPVFPTLTDLYDKIDPVVLRLGYDRRVEQDIRAGLKTRIGALRLGAKGQMLDTAHSLPMSALLANPTILELDSVGSDDEKAFLIGLILVQLYEYRRLQAREGKLPADLQHLMVVEEAHRLLQNTSTQVSNESSNMRATAVETFANILSEMRAYGQGILVAEQIPSKLIPDVIKNTNLKIVHRLVAQDDRASLGATMNLTDAQLRLVTTLPRGDAVIYAEGADHPYLTRIFKSAFTGKGLRVKNADVARHSTRYIALQSAFSFPDWISYGLRATPHGAPFALPYQIARDFLEGEGSGLFNRVLIRVIFQRNQLLPALDTLQQVVKAHFAKQPSDQLMSIMRWVLVFGAGTAVQRRASERGWEYSFADSLRKRLTKGLVTVFDTRDLSTAQPELDEFVRQYEKALNVDYGYFPGCKHCRAVCVYRPEVVRLLENVDFDEVRNVIMGGGSKSTEQRVAAAAKFLRAAALDWLGDENVELAGISFCAGLHIGETISSNRRDQLSFADHLVINYSL